jgi:Aerotolerance regulator N-terminal
MGLLYPGALIFFALVPALVIAYLARERPRQVRVSSVIAFRALQARKGERFGGRPRFNWMFFIELLILCLAVLAMAGPYLVHQSTPLAVVLDNSAAMQAKTPSGKARLEIALGKLAAALSHESARDQVTVYVTAPRPHQLAEPFRSPAAGSAALGGIEATDAPDDPAALSNLLGELASERRFSKVIFAGARPLSTPIPPSMSAITVGEPVANYALGSFTLRREALGSDRLHARLTIANFSPSAATLKVTISADGKTLGHGEASLQPGEVGGIEFPAIAPAAVYRADLQPSDGFALDNVAYATAGAVKSLSILFVSPTPGDGESLQSLPGINVETRTPGTFTPKDLARADLAVFEYTLPKEIPPVNSLFVMPPAGDPLFDFEAQPAQHIQITGWPPTNAVTDGVNFRLLNFRSGEFFGFHPWMRAIVNGNKGGLILSGTRQDHKFVATGFNPFPYLGKQNLPMSILTLNILSYLGGFGQSTAGYRTGEPWLVPAGIETIVLPSGRKVSVKPGTLFTEDASQGIYHLIGTSGEKTMRAVNLSDLRLSDFENVPPLQVQVSNAKAEPGALTLKAPLADYLIGVILALAAIEAILAYRRRRPVVQAEP